MNDEQKCPHCGGKVHEGTCQNCGASVPRPPDEEGSGGAPAGDTTEGTPAK